MNLPAWVFGEQRDERGFTVLHHASAHGFAQLIQVLLEKHTIQQQVNFEDNYGRTPLFWSMWSGSYLSSILLLSKGAHLIHQDEVKDTPLHIAVQQRHAEPTKKVLFWLLKYDDKQLRNTHAVLQAIHLKNESGFSPLELAKREEDEEMVDVLQAIRELCLERIHHAARSIYLNDVYIRNGPLIGKKLLEIDKNIRNVCLEMYPDYFVMTAERSNGNHMSMKIPHDKLAFLILAKKDQRAEFTLSSTVDVRERTKDGWIKSEKSIFATCQQFHALVKNMNDLERIRTTLRSSKALVEFQEYCYCSKPEQKTQLEKDLKNITLSVKELEREPMKICELRKRMSELSVEKIPLSSDQQTTEKMNMAM